MSVLDRPSERPNATLLIVDDSPEVLALLTEYLRPTGWRLIVAFDGMEGYHKATVLQPDIILMDVRMPRADGFAAMRLLKADERTRDIPVLFLSAAVGVEERLAGLRLGAVDYISKPFSAEEVRMRINVQLKWLHRSGSRAGEAVLAEPDSAHPLVRAAMAVLTRDLKRSMGLRQLARKVGTNERRLNQLFRDHTGVTAFAWLREHRLQQACRLLRQSELDIQSISDQVGYGSAANFTTMFRERFGVTPSAYRRDGGTSQEQTNA